MAVAVTAAADSNPLALIGCVSAHLAALKMLPGVDACHVLSRGGGCRTLAHSLLCCLQRCAVLSHAVP